MLTSNTKLNLVALKTIRSRKIKIQNATSLQQTNESIICHNDELSLMMRWVGCLLKNIELFILFSENSQILLKISVIPILLTFIYLVKSRGPILRVTSSEKLLRLC